MQDDRVGGRTAHQDGGPDDGGNTEANIGRLAQGVETNISEGDNMMDESDVARKEGVRCCLEQSLKIIKYES